MEERIVEEAKNELNWRERIVVRIFKRTFMKIYGIAGEKVFNQMNFMS